MRIDVMLCDHAQVAGGKLFISGACINQVNVQADAEAPFPVNFAVAGLVHVEWQDTNVEHELRFELLTEDGQPPLLPTENGLAPRQVAGQMTFNVGRPPQLQPGSEQIQPFIFAFPGLPLGETGSYSFVLSIDGEQVRRVPFTMIRVG